MDPSVGGSFRPSEDYIVGGAWDFLAPVRFHAGAAGAGGTELDVTVYGAAGDGITDDTAAIQRALDAVPAAGGTVYFPPGTYLVSPVLSTTWLKVKSRTIVRGDGAASVVQVKPNAGDYQTVFGAGPTLATSVTDLVFRDLVIDQNVDANTTCDVRTVSAAAQFAITAFAVERATVERVRFLCGGINTVNFNGPACKHLTVRSCHFRFLQAHANVPDYDNSAIYLNGQGLTVEGCVFEADLAENARGACEVHAGRAVVANNRCDGYNTLVNVVTQITETPALPDMGCSVTGNQITRALHGITLWSGTSRTMGNVTIAGNSIDIANKTRAAALAPADLAVHTAWGIGFTNDASGALDGAYTDLAITGNAITFEADTRAGYAFASEAGLYLVARGAIRNLLVAHNVVRGVPCQGLRLESVSSVVSGAQILANQFVDCGNNASATSGYRTAILLAGTVNQNSRVAGNTILDTGATFGGFGGIIMPGGASQVLAKPRNEMKVTAASGSYVNGYSSLATAESRGVYTISGNFSLLPGMFERYELRFDALSPASFTLSHSQSYVDGQRLIVTIVNGSGGAGPTITWTGFKLATSPAWANPANGYRKSIEFEFDGTNYKELWRSNDIPN